MATNYTPDDLKDTLGEVLIDSIVLNNLLQDLLKERGSTARSVDEVVDPGDITRGTDVVFIEQEEDSTIDLGRILDSKTIKDLNALIFTTDTSVDLTLPKTFGGTVIFGAGDDALEHVRGGKSVTVDAGDGNDTVATGSGKDTVFAGDGDDSIVTGGGKDSVVGGAGDDTIETGGGKDTIVTGSGSDSVDAGKGNDLIVVQSGGDPGDSIIEGGRGKDTLDLSNVVIDSVEVVNARQGMVTITLDDGSTLDVSHVEKFIVGDGHGGSITLTGVNSLDNLFNL